MVNRLFRRLLPALVLCAAFAAPTQAQVVVSQVYGGGGNSGAPYSNDYVELFNRGSEAVSLSGLSVQYASATGTGNFGAGSAQIVVLPAATIEPGRYFLVGLAGGATGNPLPAADASGTINMSGTAGKVALVNSTTTLGCNGGSTPCTPEQVALIVDLVGFGNANFFEGAAAAPTLGNAIAALRADGGCSDSNDNGADFATAAPAPRNSATPPAPCGGGGIAYASISDTSAAEGDSGTTPFFFTISLNQPAGEGGVSVDWATADGSATVADSDYVAASGTATIAEGATSVTISVDVVGDTTTEPDETFLVDLSNAVGAEIADAQGVGTILNDDVVTVAISAIQGDGQLSPYNGLAVATTGIVTGRKNNGFFLQTADGEDDGNPATSEGIFVFTSSTPPEAATVGNRVLVQGTVDEYIPAADPHQLPLTEIVNASVAALSGGHPLPAPVALTADLPNASDGLEQLERYEGMRVVVPSATVVAPTGGNVNEAQATATSNGRFAVVVAGTARPFREPGIPVPNPDPLGSSATDIPRWDFNPELIAVNSTTIGAPAANVAAGCTIIDGTLVGPLDYTFRRYTIYPEGALSVDCSETGLPRASRLPTPDDATFATWNVERFFDTVNDPAIGEPVLTAAAYERRLAKASLAIRGYLHAPDVLGLTEVENLTVLQTLADRINADAVAAGDPDPGYSAHLVEGNDVGGIDVGFLVKGADVAAGTPRVEVLDVTQHGAAEVLTNPDGSTSLLNDRPPLSLDGVVHFADGRSHAFTAIVVHQRSLNDVDSDDNGSSGWLTLGQRVRAKRQAQADFLAELVSGMQADDPTRNLIVMGDFNAFQFNDGLVDALGTVTGLPSPDGETAVDGDGIDRVEPNLYNLTLLAEPAERYSFVFDYQAQSLDHVLVNDALVDSPLVAGIELSHARIAADFPEIARNEEDTPSRLSDHDPSVLLVRLAAVRFADLSVEVEALAATVAPGEAMQFSAVVANAGPDDAGYPGAGFVLDAELTDLAVAAPAGWSCDAPLVAGGTSTVSCGADALAANDEAVFALTATAPAALEGSQVTLTAAATAQTEDPDPENNDAGATVLVEDPHAGVPLLENGVPVGGLEGGSGAEAVYRIEVPAGAGNLRVLSYGGSGDVTLYVAHDRIPTATDFDGRSQRPGNNETIAIAAPAPGTWFVKLVGVRTFRNVSVRASFD
ncbi:nuclease [Luteimonas marina]|uniref:Nuclease n=1 Tax=Luteimonas marina TaxID=488485 RepID=A0A5C5TYU7_9GAMM|nr:pre-peptidase C-terminal domain-containing protein [Luteimonas marina]TWT18689.1 nuclease [Luteimonas marina]